MAILAAGSIAPDFDLADVEGESRSLGGARAGGQALLAFFSLECRACDLSYLFWDRMTEAYGDAGCPVLAISLDSSEAAHDFWDRSGVSFTVLADPGHGVTRAYGIECTPALFLVDAGGTIVASHDAFDRAALNALSQAIAERVGEPAVELGEDEAPAFSPGCVVHLATEQG
ncbi:MAG: redoxin domain-containing protein [Dehalococcoidia bacterium]|nr:redoxin domain-containing protein [Dehalococcoidia bacterium]